MYQSQAGILEILAYLGAQDLDLFLSPPKGMSIDTHRETFEIV